MLSPFPGMDPFLESQLWDDFHSEFIPAIRAQLVPLVRPGYLVNIERSVFLTEDGDIAEHFRPDVLVAAAEDRSRSALRQTPATATLEPRLFTVPEPYEVSQKFLTIRTREDRRVVTVIELLSPTNKDSRGGLAQYLAKRASSLKSLSNVVEIDLLRGGRRLPTCEPLPSADYHTFVSRSGDRSHAAAYSWQVSDKLPQVPIPLAEGDDDVPLNLQAAFDEAFARGGYADGIDYRAPLDPPPTQALAAWIEHIVPGNSRS